ncbi:hypothetical protein [Sphingomonas sp. ERG5]|uniref:hypothetical protein n=1 Tax=Sphingomonas sp. ERG5 TaxID=1381597 RepID=UPI001269F96D|nr:hypothetical protein [Sphingomonas sp. ERG5]
MRIGIAAIQSALPADRHANFPQLREFLRENAFLSVLRESAGKAAGILMEPHGNFAARLREYRESFRG